MALFKTRLASEADETDGNGVVDWCNGCVAVITPEKINPNSIRSLRVAQQNLKINTAIGACISLAVFCHVFYLDCICHIAL